MPVLTFADSWGYVDTVTTAYEGGSSNSSIPPSCEACEQLNTLYEAELPGHESRMEGMSLSVCVWSPAQRDSELHVVLHTSSRHMLLLHDDVCLKSVFLAVLGHHKTL